MEQKIAYVLHEGGRTTAIAGYTPENKEEIEAVNELLQRMRAERQQREAYVKNREYLREIVISTIDAIGLEDTKKIIREINRDLRGGNVNE